MKFKAKYWIGIILALALFAVDYYLFFGKRWFYPLIIVCVTIAWIMPWNDFFKESKRQKEIETKFLEFVRTISSDVRSGIPISKSVLHAADKDFGALTPYTKKLASQVAMGIPFHKSFNTFSNDTGNKMIKTSISIILEAEKSGGNIADILDSVTESVLNVNKLKQERKASVFSQIVQGYIVFFIFIGIMLVLQLWLFPKLGNISGGVTQGLQSAGIGGLGGAKGEAGLVNLDMIFLGLIIIQGFFAGIMIGKFSEGTFKQGLLHSLVLITCALLIITTAKGGLI